MKKFLVASIVIASSLSIGGVSSPVHAADAGTVAVQGAVDEMTGLSPSVIEANVGDTITVANEITGAMPAPVDVGSDASPGEGRLSVGSSNCWPFQAEATCNVAPGATTTYTVVELGFIKVEDSSSNLLTFEIVAPNSHRARPKQTVTLDPAGGVCSGHSEPWTESFRGSLDLPTKDDCSRVGYEFLGWGRASDICSSVDLEDCLLTSKVSRSGDLMAAWREVSPPEPPGLASGLVNFLCGPCDRAAIWWEPSPSAGVTYQIVVSTGDPRTISSTYNVTQPATALAPFTLSSLVPNVRYTIELFAVRAGVRSPGAFFNPITSEFASSSEDQVSSVAPIPTQEASFTLRDAPENRTIQIACERTTVSGKPGVVCQGSTTGFATGDKLIPMVRFPGQVEYTASSARPVVDAVGDFYWQRKTGKKVYVYFVSEDGKTKSGRLIIPAM